jgi:hypothetical protein
MKAELRQMTDREKPTSEQHRVKVRVVLREKQAND